MAENVERIEAEIITVTRAEGTDLITARVKLHFRLTDQAGNRPGEIVTSVNLRQRDDFHWKRTKHLVTRHAWDWLDAYFDGRGVGSECSNLFREVFAESTAPNEYGLTPEQERSLARELRRIEQDFAA